ncbi:MAG: sulfatase-like hydrolase/transferase [Opitutales bacterium]
MNKLVLLIFSLVLLVIKGYADNRPNIIFLFADDHGYCDVGAYGNDEVHTPNIDRLAREGTRFSHAYNMGSWQPAVCIPSRTMLQTGQTLWNTRQYDAKQWVEDGRFWSQLLSAAGYNTYMTGKWHVPGVHPDVVYHTVRNRRPGMPNQTPAGYERPSLPSQVDPWSPYDISFEGFWRGGKHWSEVMVDDFEIFLEDAVQKEDPFFMFVAFNAPHDPRQAPREFVEMYPQENIRLPENYLPEYPYNEEIASGRDLRDERLAPFPRTPYATRVQRSEFYAIITHMDHQIGRMLRAVEAAGIKDNTWIVFSADHGLGVGQHGLMGKQNMYDHSLRVPFIIVGPGAPQGQILRAPIYVQDIMPTVLELAKVKVPEHVEFNSVLPLLRGQRETSHYDAIYGAYLDRQRAVIHDDYKLIAYPEAKVLRLYNLADDPHEIMDLAGEDGQQARIRDLVQRLQTLQQELNDPLDLAQAFPDWF